MAGGRSVAPGAPRSAARRGSSAAGGHDARVAGDPRRLVRDLERTSSSAASGRGLVTRCPPVRARPSAPRSARRYAGAACTSIAIRAPAGRSCTASASHRAGGNGPHGALCGTARSSSAGSSLPDGEASSIGRPGFARAAGAQEQGGESLSLHAVAAPGTVGQFSRARRRPAVGRSAAAGWPTCPVPLLDLLQVYHEDERLVRFDRAAGARRSVAEARAG